MSNTRDPDQNGDKRENSLLIYLEMGCVIKIPILLYSYHFTHPRFLSEQGRLLSFHSHPISLVPLHHRLESKLPVLFTGNRGLITPSVQFVPCDSGNL